MNLSQLKRLVREEVRRAMGRKLMESPVNNNGYKQKWQMYMHTTWKDFSDIEKFGDEKIMALYDRVCALQKEPAFWFGLCLTLRRKCNHWRSMDNKERAGLYYKLFKDAAAVVENTHKQEKGETGDEFG